MADEKIRYVLDVDDKGTPKLVKFGNASETAGKKAEKSFAGAGDAISSLGERIPRLGGAMSALSSGPLIAGAAGVAAIVGGFGMMVMSSVDAADSMRDLSLRLGISTERLSVLSLYAEQSGTDIDTLAKAMGKLGAKVADGDGTLKKMGVTANSTDEALFQVADKIAATEDPMIRLKLATDAFGKSGQEMLPLLVQGGSALRAMGGSAAIVTTEMAQMSDEFNDGMAVLKAQAADVGMKITTAVLPHMLAWLEGVDNIRLGLNSVLDLLFDIDPLLNASESRSKDRNAIIEQYAELQKVKTDAANAGYISKADAAKSILIEGKTLQAALAAFDEARKQPARTPATETVYGDDGGQAKRDAEARKAEADRLKAIDDEQKFQYAMFKAREEGVEAERKLHEDAIAFHEAAYDKQATGREEERKKLDDENALIMKTEEDRLKYNADLEKKRALAQAQAVQDRNAAIAASFAPLQGFMQSFSASLLNGEASMAGFLDSFKQMIVGMVAELAANAAIFGLLNLVSGGAAGSFLGGLGGLSKLVLGSFAVGTRSLATTGPILAHQGEAILPRGISQAARAGDWAPAMRFMGQSSTNNATTNHINVTVHGGGNVDPNAIAQSIIRAQKQQDARRLGGSF